MAQAPDTESSVFDGKVRGYNYSTKRLKRWMVEIWGHVLEQLQAVLTMTRGWFSLIFAQPNQAN